MTVTNPMPYTPAIFYFALTQLRAAGRNFWGFAATQLTSILILTLFAITAGEEKEILNAMFPAIVGMTLMMSASTQAIRIANWRQQHIFQRLSVTPLPLGYFLLGDALANMIFGMLQTLLTLLYGVFVLQLPISWSGVGLSFLIFTLAGACFTAYGLVIGSFIHRPEGASLVATFSLITMFFMGGGLGNADLPQWVKTAGTWLPVGAMNQLIIPLFNSGTLPDPAAWLLLALFGYTLLFITLTVCFFRPE